MMWALLLCGLFFECSNFATVADVTEGDWFWFIFCRDVEVSVDGAFVDVLVIVVSDSPCSLLGGRRSLCEGFVCCVGAFSRIVVSKDVYDPSYAY